MSYNRAHLLSPAASAASLVALSLFATAPPLSAQSLLGSHESLVKQASVAQQNGFPYLRTAADVLAAAHSGQLVTLPGNEDYQLADDVSFPYARPEVKGFVEEVAHGNRAVCGEPLVVTSLTRPVDLQPWNASPLSVHPTGMAIDLRRSARPACRHWLESILLLLEGKGLIEATRESFPPHYHVSVFPDQTLLASFIGEPIARTRVAVVARRSHGRVRMSQLAQGTQAGNRRTARGHVRTVAKRAHTARRRKGAVAHRAHRGARVRVAH